MTTVENNNEMGMIGMFLYEAMKNYELFDRGVFRSILVPYIKDEIKNEMLQKIHKLKHKLITFCKLLVKTQKYSIKISNIEFDMWLEKPKKIGERYGDSFHDDSTDKWLEKVIKKTMKVEDQYYEVVHKYCDIYGTDPKNFLGYYYHKYEWLNESGYVNCYYITSNF